MEKGTSIQIFEEKKVRTIWDDEQEKWYFSIVDAVEVLTNSPNPGKYWSVLKTRLKAEGSQLATNCSQLKMQSADGTFYETVTNLHGFKMPDQITIIRKYQTNFDQHKLLPYTYNLIPDT